MCATMLPRNCRYAHGFSALAPSSRHVAAAQSASLDPPKEPEFMGPALEAVQEMIDDVAGGIDEIAEDLPRKRRAIS